MKKFVTFDGSWRGVSLPTTTQSLRLGVFTFSVGVWLLMLGGVFAQGTIQFNNRVPGSVDAPVFDMGGTVKLAGDAWWAQLYAGPSGSASSALVAVQPAVNFRTGNAAGYVVTPGEVTIPGVAPGAKAQIELRAWAAPYASYEAAIAAGARAGASASFESLALGGSVGGAPPTPGPALVGLTSFSFIPEPSTIALGMVALATFACRRLRVNKTPSR